ncbi:MAG: class I SAM-dependent methyltransferase [Peptococcaceae bacterium]|nr:class I SAM-dependent methyltransferase [Peptococcaceae bacterium]
MYAVTTSLRANKNLLAKAEKISGELKIPLLTRNNRSIDQIILENNLHGVLVVGKGRLSYVYPGGEFFFHPGMAKLRINEVLNGKTDQMIKALDITPGDRVLDCTLGMGSDAIVISFVNEDGEVIGIEQSPVISLIVREGLATYGDGTDSGLERAMRRIKVICADHREFLRTQPDRSADLVYFDPMFRLPGKRSCAIGAMRPLADYSPLSEETLREALRVARRRVVVKEARNSREFSRLGIEKIAGGKHSPVAYGIIEKRGG